MKTFTEREVLDAIDAYIVKSMNDVRNMEPSDIKRGAMTALTGMRIAIRDDSWRPEPLPANVVKLFGRK